MVCLTPFLALKRKSLVVRVEMDVAEVVGWMKRFFLSSKWGVLLVRKGSKVSSWYLLAVWEPERVLIMMWTSRSGERWEGSRVVMTVVDWALSSR